MHWSYCCLALSHQHDKSCSKFDKRQSHFICCQVPRPCALCRHWHPPRWRSPGGFLPHRSGHDRVLPQIWKLLLPWHRWVLDDLGFLFDIPIFVSIWFCWIHSWHSWVTIKQETSGIDGIWGHWSGSALAQVMALCHQCWLTINKVKWHSSEGNVTRNTSATNH